MGGEGLATGEFFICDERCAGWISAIRIEKQARRIIAAEVEDPVTRGGRDEIPVDKPAITFVAVIRISQPGIETRDVIGFRRFAWEVRIHKDRGVDVIVARALAREDLEDEETAADY